MVLITTQQSVEPPEQVIVCSMPAGTRHRHRPSYDAPGKTGPWFPKTSYPCDLFDSPGLVKKPRDCIVGQHCCSNVPPLLINRVVVRVYRCLNAFFLFLEEFVKSYGIAERAATTTTAEKTGQQCTWMYAGREAFQMYVYNGTSRCGCDSFPYMPSDA